MHLCDTGICYRCARDRRHTDPACFYLRRGRRARKALVRLFLLSPVAVTLIYRNASPTLKPGPIPPWCPTAGRGPVSLCVFAICCTAAVTYKCPYYMHAGLVMEDAPAGIASGRTAGCKTLAVVTSHTRETMELSEPTYLVNNLSK